MTSIKRVMCAALLCWSAVSRAHGDAALSQASALSAVPVAMSMVAPAAVLSAGATLTVVSVSAVAEGTVWVLARASDGARVVLRCSTRAASEASVAAGVAVTVVALSSGWLLSTASEVIAFVPSQLGESLLYNERLPD
jgi:hypothetical protein